MTFGPRYLNFFFSRYGYTSCRRDGQKFFEKQEQIQAVKIEQIEDQVEEIENKEEEIQRDSELFTVSILDDNFDELPAENRELGVSKKYHFTIEQKLAMLEFDDKYRTQMNCPNISARKMAKLIEREFGCSVSDRDLK